MLGSTDSHHTMFDPYLEKKNINMKNENLNYLKWLHTFWTIRGLSRISNSCTNKHWLAFNNFGCSSAHRSSRIWITVNGSTTKFASCKYYPNLKQNLMYSHHKCNSCTVYKCTQLQLSTPGKSFCSYMCSKTYLFW